MRILEVRDGFIKFETEKNVSLSSFLQINDIKKRYIAQVIQVKNAGDSIIAYAKILFLYDGTLQNYDKTLPSKDAEISEFDFDILSKSFEYTKPVVSGVFTNTDTNILIDKTCFDKNMLICTDNAENNKTILSNLTKQFEKSLVIDTLGITNTPKFTAGVDFKLPLNTDALEFMFEDCLNDATSDSKSLIKEIFQDLADYSKTVPFVPFGALKTIIDDMVEKSHVFKLLVLKNKLAKFDKQGYFAATASEAENLNKILGMKNAIIDLSKLDAVFQNRYLSVIYSEIEKQNLNTQIFLEASNTVDKKNLKKVLTGNLAVTFITHSRFKYINEIKSLFENFIIEPSFTANEVFKTYSMFLNSMQKGTYLITGKSTNYIPLVSAIRELVSILEIIEKPAAEVLPPQEEAAEEIDKTVEEPVIEIEEEFKTDNVIEESETIQEEEFETVAEPQIFDTQASVEAIEQKSDDLINKVTEEVQTEEIPETLNLFSDEEETEEENEEEDIVVSNSIQEKVSIEETFEAGLPITEEKSFEEPVIEAEFEELADNQEVLEESLDEPALEEVSPEQPVELNELDLEESEIQEEALPEEPAEEFHTQVDEVQTIEIPEDISELAEETESLEGNEEPVELENTETELPEPDFGEIKLRDYSKELDSVQEVPDIIPISENSDDDFDAIVELDESEASDDDIIVDFTEDEEPLENEDLDKAIVKDVDKVFTTMKEDTISDSDLDFIDELNESEEEEVILSDGMEELSELAESEEQEDGFLEPLEEVNDFVQDEPEEKEILETKNSSTPIVPVYGADIPAEDMVMSDPIEQGDTVVHAKYGNGVVEKMIKYGTKTLYSINFDNVGRRLLDPTLTEIKKS